MRYYFWLWFYRFAIGTWSPLHRLRCFWLDVQIAALLARNALLRVF